MYGTEFEQKIETIVARYPQPKAALLPVLWEVQTAEGWVSSEAEAFRELGLESGTSLKSVKAAFRKLVKELHPDKRGGDRSTEPRLRRLVAAYQFLRRKMGAHPSSSR